MMCRALTFTGSICQIVRGAMCLFFLEFKDFFTNTTYEVFKYITWPNPNNTTALLQWFPHHSLWTCASNKKFNGYPHLIPTTHKSMDMHIPMHLKNSWRSVMQINKPQSTMWTQNKTVTWSVCCTTFVAKPLSPWVLRQITMDNCGSSFVNMNFLVTNKVFTVQKTNVYVNSISTWIRFHIMSVLMTYRYIKKTF
jgi:hypothetical protein